MRITLPLLQRKTTCYFRLNKISGKCIYLLIIIALNSQTEIKAQVSTYYTWSQTAGAYTPGISTTSATPANIFSTSWDDVAYSGYSLPFTFTYNGTAYTNVGVDADGWITFSNGVPAMTGQAGGGSWVSISDHTGVYLNGTANNNGFAAFNCDIYDQAFATFTGTRTNGSPTITGVSSTANLQIGTRLVGTGITDGTVITNIAGTTVTMSSNSTANNASAVTPRASIYAFTRGTAPNREFVVQWTQAKRYNGTGTENLNFQVILNEGNGNPTLQTLQSVYGLCTTSNLLTLNVQVGLRGSSSADFNARAGNAWAGTTTAIANTDQIRFSNTINPASGLTFTWSPCTTAPGAPGAISGTSPVCANTSSTYSITAVAGATIYSWAYSGTGASFTSPTASPSVAISFAPGATSGTLSVTTGNICGTNAAVSTLPITVNAVPVATISYPAAGYCTSTAGTIPVTQTGQPGGTYSVSPSGLSLNNASGAITPVSSSVGTYSVTYSFTNGTCPNTTTTTVSINAIPVATGSATPAIMCSGGNSQLSVTAASAGYTVNPVAFSSLAPSGTPTNIFNVYTDESISAAIALPFTFTFYGQAITQFYASSNGYIQLQSGPLNSLTPQTLPNATTPNNVIALAWDDLVVDPATLPGSNIRYFVNGVSPNRVVVIDFVSLSFYGFPNVGNMTGQIRLYESDNHIEVAAGTVNDAGQLDNKTLGIENSTGTAGLAPAGRNNVVWNLAASETWGFSPVNYTYLWSPSTFLSSTTISNPIATAVTATTNYSVQVTNTTSGCATSVSVPVTISAPLNGLYTVGAGGNYTTLTAAVNAYNTICISGPVTFSLIDNLYSASETFPISINSNAYQSAVNTLTIRPAGGVSATISGAAANDALVKISGKYITINGSNNNSTTRNLSITNTSNTVPSVVLLGSVSSTAPVTNVSVKNCVITNGVNTSSAVVVSSNIVATAGYFSNDTIQNNLVQKAYIGIYCIGVNGSGNGNGLNILSNDLNSSGANALSIAGIYAQDIDGVTIQYNQVGNLTGTDSYDDKGIWLATGVKNSSILNNKVTNLNYTGGLGYGAYGICLTTGVANANILVANNMISNISGDGFNYNNATYGLDNPVGIMLFTTQSGIKLYFNSINLGTAGFTNTLSSSNAISAGIRLHTGSTANIRNNIIVNNLGRTGGAASGYGAIGILAATNNTQFTTINYNDYSIAPSGSITKYFGQINTTGQTTLAGWQGASAGEANGINVVPVFAAATDLHLSPAASNLLLNNTGTPIPAITIDYDTTTRNGLTPDMGADEFLAPNAGSWVGKTSIDWLINTNWETNKIPDATTDVTITGGYTFMPAIVTVQPVRGLILTAPVPANTPILTLNNGTIQIYGTITRTGGSIDGSNGTVEMNGTAAQPIPASLFTGNNLKNLVIGNNAAAGVTIGGTLDIYRSLTFSVAGLKLTTGNFLTFKSTATETAWLGDVTGKTIVGNATVERYLPTGINHGKSWQLLSVPVSGAQSVKASWQEGQNPTVVGIVNYGTTISSEKAGATGRGYDFVTAPGPSIKTYDPVTNTFVGIDNGVTNTSSLQIANQKGYMILVRGDRTVQTSVAAATPTTLRTSGRLFTATAGELPPVTTVLPNKFASIGNPYASAIDFTAVTRASGIDNVFYVWDPLLAGSNSLGGYQTISSVTGYFPTPGSANYPSGAAYSKIQSGQAFYVHGTGGGSLSFTEAAKLAGSQLVLKSTSTGQRQVLRVNLYKISSMELGPVDGNAVAFDPAFSNDFESQDALKLVNTGENFGIRSNDQILAVEAKEPIVNTDTIFYNLANLRHEAYQFRFGPDNMNFVNQQAFLVDRFLNTQTHVSLNDSTVIDFDITSDAASSAVDRFYLVFKQLVIVPVTITHISATRTAATNIAVDWKVDNEINIEQYEVERSGDGRNFNKLHALHPKLNNGGSAGYHYDDGHPFNTDNFYRIKATSQSGLVQYSTIVKVAAIKMDASISIYPNPVVDKIMNVEFINQVKGIYQLDLVDQLGQSVYSSNIMVNGNILVESIQIGKSIAAGNYQLKIIAPGKKTISKQVMIQ